MRTPVAVIVQDLLLIDLTWGYAYHAGYHGGRAHRCWQQDHRAGSVSGVEVVMVT